MNALCVIDFPSYGYVLVHFSNNSIARITGYSQPTSWKVKIGNMLSADKTTNKRDY